jgi:hypothetical protein
MFSTTKIIWDFSFIEKEELCGGTETIKLTQLKKSKIFIGRRKQLIINWHYLSKKIIVNYNIH